MIPKASEKYKLKDKQRNSDSSANEVSIQQESNQQTVSEVEKDLRMTNMKNRPILFAKIGIVFIVLIAHFLYTRKFNSPRKSVECLSDQVSQMTEGINTRLNTDTTLLKFLQVSSSMIIDFADLSVIVAYNLRGVTMAYPLQVIFFYVSRGIVQGLFMFGYPKGIIWSDPGIPSLSVPYGVMSDFYFSGHCGFMTMMALENYKLGNKKNALALFVLLPYVAFILIATRVHYSIDVVIGIMVAIYCHYMAHKYINYFHMVARWMFNRWLWHKIPFFSEV